MQEAKANRDIITLPVNVHNYWCDNVKKVKVGDHVTFLYPHNGYECDKKRASDKLLLCKKYKIVHKEISSYLTTLHIEGHPEGFSSSYFCGCKHVE